MESCLGLSQGSLVGASGCLSLRLFSTVFGKHVSRGGTPLGKVPAHDLERCKCSRAWELRRDHTLHSNTANANVTEIARIIFK